MFLAKNEAVKDERLKRLRWMCPFIHFWSTHVQVTNPHMPPMGNWENTPLLCADVNGGHGGHHLQWAQSNGVWLDRMDNQLPDIYTSHSGVAEIPQNMY